ncbi:MAG: YbjN domain-containing protein [Proteobacteria bacterium]|nr:YbjN domain-containing protein [Pseudomonadota bacterium]
MRTKEDVEQYLIDLDTAYENLGDGVYRLYDDMDEVDDIIVLVTEPLVVFSVRLMKVPTRNREAFFKKLLELNASALVAGAYGLDGDHVIITDTLQLENLDFNEFQASVETLVMAIHDHYPMLMEMCKEADGDDDAAEEVAEEKK